MEACTLEQRWQQELGKGRCAKGKEAQIAGSAGNDNRGLKLGWDGSGGRETWMEYWCEVGFYD